jgi:16S rRNA (adenine1518-N6/adenine1519-N6)-dimethyltransferase
MSAKQSNKNSASSYQAKKRFGQNFLVDQNIINKIVASVNLVPEDLVLEIGPGLGALTKLISTQCQNLVLVEVDRELAAKLSEEFQAMPHVQLINQDVLKVDLVRLHESHAKSPQKFRVIGNLPYNISTPLIFKLLAHATIIQDMCFMLQQEVVDRLVAVPKSKAYGRLSVMVQYYCKIQKLFTVANTAFQPQPKVQSAIVRLTPHQELPHLANNFNTFADITRIAFTKRRKTITNALKGIITASMLEQLQLAPTLRPEELSVADYVNLSNLVSASTGADSSASANSSNSSAVGI